MKAPVGTRGFRPTEIPLRKEPAADETLLDREKLPDSDGHSWPDDARYQGLFGTFFRPSMFWTPERQTPSAWTEHVPFAFWLVDVLRPRTIVELGTERGMSYSAMCQAVKSLSLATRCFAVDTWKGDEHAGFYPEEVYKEFAAFHDAHYSAFSRLIRSSFDEALSYFEDGSIDLLHIDGFHTYEAVRHDFDFWQAKLSADAVVLLHDINVRENNFAVFRLWSEVTAGQPHFAFLHGHGLGVLGHGRHYPPSVQQLFGTSDDDHLCSHVRETFAGLGRSVRLLNERIAVDRGLIDRGEELATIQRELAQRGEKVTALEQALSERGRELDGLRNELRQRGEKVTGLEEALSGRGRALDGLRNELGQRGEKVTALEQALSERGRELDGLKNELRQRGEKVMALEQALSERGRELDGLRNELRERGEKVTALEQTLAERKREIDDIAARLSVRESLVSALAESLSARTGDVERYGNEAALAQSAQLPSVPSHESFEEVLHSSLSWRIAAPLRLAERLLIRLRYSAPAYAFRLGYRAFRTRSEAPLRDWQATRAIEYSYFFDREWYVKNNADVATWGIDPVRHYFLRGASRGRDPSPYFSTRGYLMHNPDVAAAGINPLRHFVQQGIREGRVGTWRGDPLRGEKASFENSANVENRPHDADGRGENSTDAAAVDAWADYKPMKSCIAGKEAARINSLNLNPVRIFDLAPQDPARAAEALCLPACAEVAVSIIVPVFNNIRFTLECLHSIARHAHGQPAFEIIVADDASTDETSALLPKVKNVSYVRNEENLGFLRNCNNAAKSARGRYLLFLNNDVQVTENWLTALVTTFEKERNVGAAGPKMIYPSGRLQEAGALLNRDATAQLVGLTDDPSLPRYNYRREVDYCSGACLLVERERFWELGGFSDEFAPGYCEDAELCLKLRARGLRIIYNPAAVIVHHLSKTTDGMDKSYKMRSVVTNQQKLAERWQNELDELNEIKVIAFYLPQFHAIPENDAWWGKGFTDWTSVVTSTPNFPGHYQPRRPADLGYYDLRVPDVMNAQAALARSYGIHGFCYYYYRFASRRLLEMPIERMLRTGEPDFPFCLCWANENWTRRWDGKADDVLMAQHHSDDDDSEVIRDLLRYFASKNYIRIANRPLVLVYRVDRFPDFRRTAAIWRDICRREGFGEIYLAMVASFDLASQHPAKFGCDAMVEFPPHAASVRAYDQPPSWNPNFQGEVYDYRASILSFVGRPVPPFTRFRSAMPSWDNSPRLRDDAHIFINSSPGAFQAWLETIMQQTREQNPPDQRFVFINAWNEWGEGAYLEPDIRFGHAYLEAIRNAHELWHLARP